MVDKGADVDVLDEDRLRPRDYLESNHELSKEDAGKAVILLGGSNEEKEELVKSIEQFNFDYNYFGDYIPKRTYLKTFWQ